MAEKNLRKKSHPAFIDIFDVGCDDVVATKFTPRFRAGAKRSVVKGPEVYNDVRLHPRGFCREPDDLFK